MNNFQFSTFIFQTKNFVFGCLFVVVFLICDIIFNLALQHFYFLDWWVFFLYFVVVFLYFFHMWLFTICFLRFAISFGLFLLVGNSISVGNSDRNLFSLENSDENLFSHQNPGPPVELADGISDGHIRWKILRTLISDDPILNASFSVRISIEGWFSVGIHPIFCQNFRRRLSTFLFFFPSTPSKQ